MWLFTVPVLKTAITIGIILLGLFVVIQVIRWSMQSSSPNPFKYDDRKPRRPYITDQRKRDEIIKQSFSPDKVPDDLDAIIIGSGIGGMATGIDLFSLFRWPSAFSYMSLLSDIVVRFWI